MKKFHHCGYLLIFLTVGFLGCKAVFYSHDPGLAECTALNFSKALLIKKNLSDALSRGSNELRLIPKNKVLEAVKQMHPNKFPDTLKPVIYQIYPALNRIDVFIIGSNQNIEKFIYKLQIVGDVTSKYKVIGIFRITKPPELSNLVLEGEPKHCNPTD